MKNEYVSKHSKPESSVKKTGNTAPQRRSDDGWAASAPSGSGRTASTGNRAGRSAPKKAAPKRSAGIIILLLLIILAAAGILVYLAVNVFQLELPFLPVKAEATPVPTEEVTPAPTAEPTPVPTPEPTATPEVQKIYTAEAGTLDNGGSYVSADAWTQDGLYASSWTIADDGYSYLYQISSIDSDGTAKQLGSYRTMDGLSNEENWNNYFSSAVLTAVSAAADGTPVALECVSSSGETTDGETVESRFSTRYFARALNSEGAELSSVELAFEDPEETSAVKAFRINSAGNYILMTDTGTAMFGADGTLLSVMISDSYTDSMVLLSDGRAGIVTWGPEGQSMNALSEDGSAFEDLWELPDSACVFADGAGKYVFFYSTGVELYGVNGETDEAEEILNWSAMNVSGIRVSGFVSRDGTDFVCVTNKPEENGRYTSELVKLTRKEKTDDGAAEQQELVLVSVSPMENLQDAVAEFNKGSAVKILLRTFEMGETEEETLAALNTFVEEELDGKMPDLIDMTGMPYEEMAVTGLLEDLYPYLDADTELDRTQILPQILSALEIDGKICATCSGFSLSTVIGPKKVIGDRDSWTFNEYSSVTSTMGDGISIFDGYTTRDTVLYEELGLNADSFVDWSALTCDFSSETFVKLLKFVKNVPEYTEDPDSVSVGGGNQFLERTTLFSFDDIILAANDFDQNEVYVGMPVAEGYGNGLNLYRDFAMSSSCTDKQAAWQFLRTCFTEAYQTGENFWYFPSNLNAFENALAEARTVQTDASGNNIVRAALLQEGKDPQYFYQLTDTMAAEVRALAEHVNGCCCSEAIYNLVSENAAGYFDGTESAEAAAEAVQEAVSAYLTELAQQKQ